MMLEKIRQFTLAAAGTLLLCAVSLLSAQGPLTGFEHSVAVYPRYSGELLMIPTSGPKLPLSVAKRTFGVIASDGKTLYAYQEGPPSKRKSGLQKIDLLTGRVSTVPGSSSFNALYGLAISAGQDRIFFAAVNESWNCGYYLLSLPEGHVRIVREPMNACELGASASISPDGTKVLIEGKKVELLDLNAGTERELRDYRHLSWSPNGKWIAASSNGRVVLLDPISFQKKKSLGETLDEQPAWSPDSKFLLIGKPCMPYFYSLAVVDVETGKRAELPGSHCEVQLNGQFVVSDEVYFAQLHQRSPQR